MKKRVLVAFVAGAVVLTGIGGVTAFAARRGGGRMAQSLNTESIINADQQVNAAAEFMPKRGFGRQHFAKGDVAVDKEAMLERMKKRHDAMVEKGILDQEKADEWYSQMKEALDNWDGTTPMPMTPPIFNGETEEGLVRRPDFNGETEEGLVRRPGFGGETEEGFVCRPGFGGGMPRKRGMGPGLGMVGEGFASALDQTAAIMGMTVEDLKQSMADGKNLFDLLSESGKLEEYKEAMLAKSQEALDKMVAEGEIDQEKADELLNQCKERMDKCFSAEGAFFPKMRGRMRSFDKQDISNY